MATAAPDFVSSDDGSAIWLGDAKVVDNDSLHGTVEKSGRVLLKPGYRNKVILLTDGYLNFDPATQATRPARTYMQVGRLRVVPDWRTEFPKVALAATGTSFHDRDVEMVVLEVAPKLQPRSIHETEILQRYWTSFCDSIGVQHQPAERSVLTNTTPESEVRRLLTDYLASELKP